MSMLTGLKASSLTCKCVFYRPKHNAIGVPNELNYEGLEMQKWNISTDRVRRVDDKNWFISLVFMLIPIVMVIKMSKMAQFLSVLLIAAKN